MAEPYDFDVAIIGGGPAGSAMAGYLAKAGISCVIFEREIMPREHVGESLVPSSTRVFNDLGLIPKMFEYQYPLKYGAAWTSATTGREYSHDWEIEHYADIRFDERAQPGVDLDHTWHIDRGKFDLMLLQHVNAMGATVYQGIRVSRVEIEPDGAKVFYKIGKREASTSVRMIVDASGRNTLVGNQMGWKVKDPVFDQYALHTWFENYDRGCLAKDQNRLEYIYIHFLPISNSWVWQIPITDTITSIGVVTQKKNFAVTKQSREDFFWECLRSREEFQEALAPAKQLRPLKAEGDYSYAMEKIVDDRIMLIGDAGRFVDPIFSTGVSIALNSARFASKDIIGAMETGDFSAKAFSEFESTIRRGTKNWHDFITVYYRLNILFTAFVNDPRYRLDVLKLLQGDVYDNDQPEVLTVMKDLVSTVENTPDHLWHKLLNDLTSSAFAPKF